MPLRAAFFLRPLTPNGGHFSWLLVSRKSLFFLPLGELLPVPRLPFPTTPATVPPYQPDHQNAKWLQFGKGDTCKRIVMSCCASVRSGHGHTSISLPHIDNRKRKSQSCGKNAKLELWMGHPERIPIYLLRVLPLL